MRASARAITRKCLAVTPHLGGRGVKKRDLEYSRDAPEFGDHRKPRDARRGVPLTFDGDYLVNFAEKCERSTLGTSNAGPECSAIVHLAQHPLRMPFP